MTHRSVAVVVCAVLACTAAVFASEKAPGNQTDPIEKRAAEALRLKRCDVITLDVIPQKGQSFIIDLPMGGRWMEAHLHPKSVRAENYEVVAQVADGSYVKQKAAPVNTFRGTLKDDPAAIAAASIVETGLIVTVGFPEGQTFWLEPISDRVEGAGPNDYAAYWSSDTLASPGVCGTQALAGDPNDDAGEGYVPNVLRGTNLLCTAQLACDADREYFNRWGSVTNTENRINAVINSMNVQYERDVDIRHEITTIIVRTAEPDPYSSSGSDALLCEFITEWTNNQSGVQRDVAKLFTGRNISGTTIGQAARIGDICDNSGFCGTFNDDGAFCYSQSDCCGSFACTTDLAAHELGHLWDAVHCSCPNNTMNPSIVCRNVFSAATIASIEAHRNSRPCLDCGPIVPPTPTNDNCGNATSIALGNTAVPFTTAGATTDGPTTLCSGSGDNQIGNDIWYRYTAPCDGTVTLSLCGAGFDTKMAVYPGTPCPTSFTQEIVCNDDFDCDGDGQLQDDGFVSQVSFAITQGTQYLVRIGGFNGATGTGTLLITNPSCPQPPPNDDCVAAINISVGVTPFTTELATTDGPAHPECLNAGDDQVQADVWYLHQATCTGDLTVETCGQADFDTKIAIYDTTICANVVNRLVACNDDAGGCSGATSSLTIPVTQNSFYLIRVGGFNGATGTGSLTLDCVAVPTTGACCIQGNCTQLSEASCLTQGGTFEGLGTNCVNTDCPEPPGACCIGGGCIQTTESDCETQGGIFEGAGVACVDAFCPIDTTGACCLNGACFETLQGQCFSLGGLFQGIGSTCAQVTCPEPVGACCIDGVCFQFSETDCLNQGGTFEGVGLNCLGLVCPEPTAACCFSDGTCQELTETDCNNQGGTFQGVGTDCAGAQCPQPSGACCFTDGTCLELTAINCGLLSGTYQGDGVTCGAAACPQPVGACCFSDGSCLELTAADCGNQGGTYQGDGVTCVAAACPQPTGACCFGDGTCQELTNADCGNQGGTYFGDGSDCLSVTCPQPDGACCLATAGLAPDCFITDFADCDAQGGSFNGGGTGCETCPEVCPCDWNNDGNLNDQDFFDWANDYFTQTGPVGGFDFNNDGNQNDQDWFDFTNCFFDPAGSGC